MGRVYGTVEDDEIAELDRMAEAEGTSRSQLVTDAVLEWLARQKFPLIRAMGPEEINRIVNDLEACREERSRLEVGDTRRAEDLQAQLEARAAEITELREERDRLRAEVQGCTARGEERERMIGVLTDRVRWLEGQVALLHETLIPRLPPAKVPIREKIGNLLRGRRDE